MNDIEYDLEQVMNNPDMREIANQNLQQITDKYESDVFYYKGPINTKGGTEILNKFRKLGAKKRNNIFLMISTPGGDPNVAYKIGRYLRKHYTKIYFFVGDYCKSAGTLLSLVADSIILTEEGELGPLDIQLSKRDELAELTSGLNMNQAIDDILDSSLTFFKKSLVDLNFRGGLSTSLAGKMASELTSGMIAPVLAKINLETLGEYNRSIRIAREYGDRLKSKNVKESTVIRLIENYPSHDYAIDFSETSVFVSECRTCHGRGTSSI